MTELDTQQKAERVVAGMMRTDAYSQWLGVDILEVAPGKANSEMVGLPQRQQLERAIETVTCGSCGAANEQTHKFCADCGVKL